MVGDIVRVTVTFEKGNAYHREALKILQSQNPVETREFIVSAILYFSRSPAYHLQAGLEEGVVAIKETTAQTLDILRQYTKYMQDLVETAEKNVGQFQVPVPVIQETIREAIHQGKVGVDWEYILKEFRRQGDLIVNEVRGHLGNAPKIEAERIIDTLNLDKPEYIKDDGMGSTFKNLAEEFGG